MGIARQIRDGMVLIDGLSQEEANRRFWCVDRNGLLVESVSFSRGWVAFRGEGGKRGENGEKTESREMLTLGLRSECRWEAR